jgi:hypothetical protein
MPPQRRQYERRWLVYFDVLGWRDLVRSAAKNPDLFGIVEAALRGAKRTSTVFNLGSAHRITRFSDHVAISTPEEDEAGRWRLPCLTAGLMIRNLLEDGHCCRGALVIGDLVHRADSIFGPALVEAHDIESRVAKYPRIVLSEEAAKLCTPTKTVRFRQDRDSLSYLDYLSGQEGVTSAFLSKARARLDQQLKTQGRENDLDVAAKHGWLRNYLTTVEAELS